MDQEVAKTLGELELKLRELERELTSIGHADAQAAPPQPRPPGKLVDEAMEPSASEQALADGDGFGGPPVFGGEEVPSQAGATIERDWTVEVRETAYGEIPTPPAPPTPSGPIPGPPIPPPAPPPQPPPATPPGPPPPETPPGSLPTGTPTGSSPTETPPGSLPPETPLGSLPTETPPGYLPHKMPAGPSPPHTSSDPRRPAAVEESQSLDLAELVRFRDKLATTMDALIDEYSRLLHVERPPQPRRGA